MKRLLMLGGLLFLANLANALSGTVSDEDGAPIVGAKIKIVGSKIDVKTDADGKFAFDLEKVDELHIFAPGYSHKILHLHGEHGNSLDIVLVSSAIEQTDVIGLPLHASTIESAQPITVVAGEELRNIQTSTLGETLKNEVGVHSSYFGPVASSPVIRGLDGPRVLITQNSLDVSDASRVGPDHIVATEASTAKQIEILRGPATLFYGSGAIGGVVNIVDDRVPSSSEQKAAFAVQHNTVASENELSAAYTGGSEQFAFHVDGFWRDGDDYEIPGLAELETEEEHEEEGHDEHGDEGILENSASESQGFNIGGSLLFEKGFVGLSYGRLERLNGIPGHGHEEEEGHEEGEEEGHEEEEGHHDEEEEVKSDLEQDRWQLISEFDVDGAFLSGINTRIGYTDYEHTEVEEGGGTTFANETWQIKTDLLHQELGGWRGALSLEAFSSDFEAVGEEAFTPPSTTDRYAFAVLEEKHQGDVLWQLGARVEHVEMSADGVELESSHEEEGVEEEHELVEFDDFSFTPYSVSAGLVWDFMPRYNLGVAVTHAQRAPNAAELFSAGPHIATETFELGALFEIHEEEDGEYHVELGNDPKEEVSNNIDISLRKHEGDIGFVVNLFYNQVSDFYYLRDTGLTSEDLFGHEEEEEAEVGEEEHDHGHAEDLPVFLFEQADANFYGFEAEFVWQVIDSLKWTVWGDSIRGELDAGGNLPRIPPRRLGTQFNFEYNRWQAELSAVNYFEQNDTAENETSTDGYTMVDARVAYRIEMSGDNELTVFAKANNLTDEEARVHTSFIKNQAPLPGRGFSLGVRGSF